MSLTAGACSLATEQLWYTLPKSAYFASPIHMLVTSLIILFGGAIAFLMVWTEFTVIAETSALTIMVAGTFKEIVTGGCDLLLWHVLQGKLLPRPRTAPLNLIDCVHNPATLIACSVLTDWW